MDDFEKIEKGLKTLVEKDEYLLVNDLSERSITHKLAEYYQVIFPAWNVDCEYNKNLGQPKNIDPHEILSKMANYLDRNLEDNHLNLKEFVMVEEISKKEINRLTKQLRNPRNLEYIQELDLWIFILRDKGKIFKKTIYPDIIIHRRGKKENHIVFEAKKTINKNKKARLYDLAKLCTLVTDPDFMFEKGIFIDIPVKTDFIKPTNFKKTRFGFLEIYQYTPILKTI